MPLDIGCRADGQASEEAAQIACHQTAQSGDRSASPGDRPGTAAIGASRDSRRASTDCRVDRRRARGVDRERAGGAREGSSPGVSPVRRVVDAACRGEDAPLVARIRTGVHGSGPFRVVRGGGFRSEADARAALERALEKHRRRCGVGRRLTLAEFVHEYLAQHAVSPVTLARPRFLLSRGCSWLRPLCSTNAPRFVV